MVFVKLFKTRDLSIVIRFKVSCKLILTIIVYVLLYYKTKSIDNLYALQSYNII